MLSLAMGALGLYSAFILLVQDRLRLKQRTLLGMYSASLSLIVLHLNAINQSALWVWKALDLVGISALFCIGPLSLLMTSGHKKKRLQGNSVFHLLPAVVVFIGLCIGLIRNTSVYAPGMIHAGIYFIIQIIRFISLYSKAGSVAGENPAYQGLWNVRFSTTQLFLLLGVSVSCLSLSAHTSCILGSAALGVMILLIWARIMYSAYLSYRISIS